MKTKVIVVASLFLAVGLLLGASTQAQSVKGDIDVAGVKAPGITGLKCGDITVEAISRQMTGSPALTPKWQYQAKATGTWSSGSCSYAVKVEANSFFHVKLAADSGMPMNCGGSDTLKSTPAQASGLKVAAGETKTQAFKLNSVSCVPIK